MAETFAYYTDHSRDFVIFESSTCCLVEPDLSEDGAIAEAAGILEKIVSFHPDFHTYWMDDGNLLVGYNHPA